MVEQLIHIVDLARHMLGEPQSVYARAANLFHRDVPGYTAEDVSAIVLGYDDGRIGVLHASNAAVPGRWAKAWQIVAAGMTGMFPDWNNAELVRTGGEVTSRRIAGDRDVFVAQLDDVAAAIRDGRPPLVPLAEGAARCGSRSRRGDRPTRGGRSRCEPARFDSATLAFEVGPVRLAGLAPLIDGAVPAHGDARGWRPTGPDRRVAWPLDAGRAVRARGRATADDVAGARLPLAGIAGEKRLASLGLRFGSVGNVRRYLRNGYMSWDGSYFVEPRSAARAAAAADPAILTGHAVTALVSCQGDAAVLGFLRHDRFQSRLRFDFAGGPLVLDVETLLDGVPSEGERRGRAAGPLRRRRRRGGAAALGTVRRRRLAAAAAARGAAGHRLVLLVQPLRLDRRGR